MQIGDIASYNHNPTESPAMEKKKAVSFIN